MSTATTSTKTSNTATTSTKTSSFMASGLLLCGLCGVLIGERVFGEGSVSSVATYGGLALLLAALGMRAAAFASSSGDVRAVEGRMLGAYAGTLLAVGLYFLSSDAGLSMLGKTGDEAGRLPGVLTVAWMSALLISLFGVLFIELVYLRMPIVASVELRRVRTSLHAGLSLALSIVFLLAVNFVATERDVRKDVSYFKTTRPSDGTIAMVDKLDRPIHVVLFYEPANDVLGQLEPYFAALAGSSDKIDYEVVDVALAPEIAREHRVRDNGHVLLLRTEPDKGSDEDGAAQGEAEPAPADPHKQPEQPERGEFFRVGSTLTESRGTLKKLDSMFQESFRKLVRPDRSLYLTVGHGERNAKSSDVPAADGTSLMAEILRRLNLKSQTLGVAQGLGNAVPDGASAVAIIGPSERFLPEEVDTLLAYLRKGGRLLLMLDPDQDIGLDPLLAGLGLQMPPGTLVSDSDHMRRAFNDSDRAIVYSNSYTSHPAVTTVSRHSREVATVFYRGGAVTRSEAKDLPQPAPRVTFPLRAGRGFWRDLNGNFTRDADEKQETLTMMAAVTFANSGGNEGRAVVVGDGDFITNKLAGNNGNMLLFVDSLAWLIGNEELSGEVASEEDIPIEHSREQDKVWFYGTTFAVPVPVLLLGLYIARRRRRRSEARS